MSTFLLIVASIAVGSALGIVVSLLVCGDLPAAVAVIADEWKERWNT